MFQTDLIFNNEMIANKLFCTFSTKEDLNTTISTIASTYSILYDKIFVLESEGSNEYMCTYNIDSSNTNSRLLQNTILLHRKKGSNTLYTINSLNALIKSLNEGKLDTNFKINWEDYKNTLLLIQDNNLKQLPTKVYKIINLK